MKSLFEICKPRESVFDESKRDDTLDLSNLIDESIDYESFFDETYITDGMKQLFDSAFKRFEGTGTNGLIKLTQSMGGGKTHNMVALGLLAKYPEIREQILGQSYKNIDKEIKIVAFTGRESDVPYGIWGEVARQLGKEKDFEPYYAPLKAPGQTSWINLLKGEPILILLDELPPYLEYARTITSGMGTLADVTTNALSNLFNALGKAELSNVCLVISDLRATYESGTQLLENSFKNIENEIERSSINIEPVGSTSDDLYNILRTRLFEKQPSEEDINEIALTYREAVKEAKQMGYTNASPDSIYMGIKDSYPFHPSVKDLFARFKENQGFQQTRGFIRLTRVMVKNLYSGKNPRAKTNHLINAFDMDFNDSEMFSMVRGIKSKLTNAISHDIASNEKSVAEEIDKSTKSNDMQDLGKLILISSLGDVTNALLGLTVEEAIGYIAGPGRDITHIKATLEEYKVKAWYLYADRNNRLYFKDIKNVNAELISMIDTITNETAKQEIKKILEDKFKPTVNDCYQEVLVFPGVDEIELKSDKVTLVLFEPNSSSIGLHKDLEEFYDNEKYKNRVMFLTGQRNSIDGLIEVTKNYKAINDIINRMKNEDKVPENDTQYLQAQDIQHKVELRLLQACRDTFIVLYYPTRKNMSKSDFTMEFEENKFDAEEQVRKLLQEVEKFEKDTSGNTFKRKFEVRIFTTRQARWTDLKERVATTTAWQWHHPKALEDLKADCIKKGIWIEEGGYIDKEPPLPETSVLVRQVYKNDDTGEATLKLTPQNGDKIYYEINGSATEASLEVENLNEFKTRELSLSFLCVDSTNSHETGDIVFWKNTVKVQYETFDKDGKKHIELKSSPNVQIRYTTDGSSPKESGGLYGGTFELPSGTKFVQAIAFNKESGVYSEVLQIPIKDEKIEIDRDKSIVLNVSRSSFNTSESYKMMEILEKYKARITGVSVQIFEKTDSINNGWVELSFDNGTVIEPSAILEEIDNLRNKFFKEKIVEISLSTQKINFEKGSDFEDWIAENKYNLEDYKDKISQ